MNTVNGPGTSLPFTTLRAMSSGNNITMLNPQSHGYVPIGAKGHKESVYALNMHDSGTLLVSGGTEKVCYLIYGMFVVGQNLVQTHLDDSVDMFC